MPYSQQGLMGISCVYVIYMWMHLRSRRPRVQPAMINRTTIVAPVHRCMVQIVVLQELPPKISQSKSKEKENVPCTSIIFSSTSSCMIMQRAINSGSIDQKFKQGLQAVDVPVFEEFP